MKDNPEIVLSDEFRRTVEANVGRDPMRIALDGSVPHAAMVATQVKYLERAKNKLPSYYSAHCILPPLAFEQSSGEKAAARKKYSGGVAVDLTCGLGVDTLYLAKRFERVTAVERDATLAAIAKENFRRLGVENVLVVNASAEEFLSGPDVRADLVYADPDRRKFDGVDARDGSARGEGKKMVRLEDCSPDIVALMPKIRKIAPRLMVKLSPLFDVDEVFRIFGSGNYSAQTSVRVDVVSLDGECKEIVADVGFGSQAGHTVCAAAIEIGEAEYPAGSAAPAPEQNFEPEKYRHLVIPDVALQKARLARRYMSERGVWIESDNGYGFAAEKPKEGIMGRVAEIESIEQFDPKALKRRLRAENVRSIDILKRDFPLSTADIVRGLGVREGGCGKIAFTRAAGRLWQITLKKLIV